MSLPLIATRVLNTPLMYDQRKAEAFLIGLGGRIVDGGIRILNPVGAIDHTAFENGRPSMGKLGDQLGRAFDRYQMLSFDLIGSVAVIPIEGTLVHKGSFVGQSSGRTSYQGIQTQVAQAKRSDAVKGAVFEIDSYGGEVSGAFDAADAIAELSALKPTLAILTDNALSAGYLMAAAARQIVMPEWGRVGSIGVITMHADFSRQLANEGIDVTIISSGKHKADGHPFRPLSDDLAARMQSDADRQRDRFADYVGRFRGNRMTKAKALATEAQDYRHEDGLSLGLVDAVGKASEAFDAFVNEINRKG